MHDDTPAEHPNRDVRLLLDRATADLPPLPDLVPGAIRQGRRRRLRSRAALSAVVVGAVAAVAAPTLLLGPWAAGGPDTVRAGASRSGGELPLAPANWPLDQPLAAPTKAYPTVHVQETAGPGRQPRLTREQTELRYAFKQKVADVLTRLLPPEAGEIRVPDNGAQSYQLVSGDKTYDITFRTDAEGGGGEAASLVSKAPGADGASATASLDGTCAETAVERRSKGANIDCLDARLPDGTAISVLSRPAAREGTRTSPPVPMATFSYGGARVMLALFADVQSNTAPPVGAEQVAKVVTDPSFLQLVDFWRTHPIGR